MPSSEQRCKSEALFTWSKALHLFSLVPRASVFLSNQGALCWSWNYVCPCSFPLFFVPAKGCGQQILEICIDFVWVCCSHPCFKESSNSKDSYSMDPKMLAIIYFIIIFFSFQKSSNKAKIKLHNITKRYLTIYSQWSLKGDLCLLCMSCIFLLKFIPALGLSLARI